MSAMKRLHRAVTDTEMELSKRVKRRSGMRGAVHGAVKALSPKKTKGAVCPLYALQSRIHRAVSPHPAQHAETPAAELTECLPAAA